MSTERWIVVRDWERHQHRDAARTDVPPWIKLHTRLLSDPAFLELTPNRRLLLVGIWLEYARTRRQLPDDTRTLSRRLAHRVFRRDLETLSRAGFIEFSASKPARNVASEHASLEVEVEVELPPTPTPSVGDASKNDPAPGDDNGAKTAATVACNICGEPVQIGYRCPGCGSNPRAAGSSPRAATGYHRASHAYDRAVAMTRNEGRAYPLDAYREELERFTLTADQRARLEALWAELVDDDEALSW